MVCEECKKEFDRITDEHTTKEHLKNNLSDTIESFERENYNHGRTSFRDELEQNIKNLENQIKAY